MMGTCSVLVETFFALQLMLLALGVNSFPLLKPRFDELATPSMALYRRQSSFAPVTGIQQFGVRPRMEIRELEQNVDQWNLYLLGLTRFQAMDQTDKLSWYRVAGIHGRPYIPWDNVQPASGIDYPGYCMHVLNIFLTWHRAYLALFEQTLYTHIIDAVNEFPAGAVRQRYAAAALSWRIPYWDWAAPPPSGQSVFPASVSSPTINVTMPNGTSTIPNPLFAYTFHPVSAPDFYYSPFSVWNQTMRYPTDWSENAVSQNSMLGPIFDNNRVSFQDRLYNLFTNYNNFTEFGNEAWENGGVSNADSLESIHDAIHSIIGSNGHMTYFDYSAFDPLFFLHHAMLDRCFALWQAIYNNSYVEPMAAVEQTYTIPVGAVKDVDSHLEPFHSNSNGDFWTSRTVRSTTTFGYTYSDLGNGSVLAVKAAVNKLYGSNGGKVLRSKRSDDRSSPLQREIPGPWLDGASAHKGGSDGKYRQYLANILTEKFALNGSYAVYIFIGGFDDKPTSWPTDPNLVGTHAVFAAMSGGDTAHNSRFKRRQDGSPVIITASMPLTTMLLAKVQSGELRCMEQDTVEPYLASNLHWRVAKFDGTQVPVEDLTNLNITVVSAEMQPAPADDEFPVWGNFTEMDNVTKGKPGGC